jgi:hypothetical protein
MISEAALDISMSYMQLGDSLLTYAIVVRGSGAVGNARLLVLGGDC